jgi:cytochrome b involved in lipid metabolism
MKKYVTVSLIVCGIVLVVAITLVLSSQSQPTNIQTTNIATSTNTTKTSSETSTSATTPTKTTTTNATIQTTSPASTLTASELAKHNSAESCWLLISGKIYDVTAYLNQHPAGANIIIKTCGIDATEAYDTKAGKGKPHSSEANAMLTNYYIGDLK